MISCNINTALIYILFNAVESRISWAVRKLFGRNQLNGIEITPALQQSSLFLIQQTVESDLQEDFPEEANKQLVDLLLAYTDKLCNAMIEKAVTVSYLDKMRYGWDGLSDYFLLTMHEVRYDFIRRNNDADSIIAELLSTEEGDNKK